MWQGHARTHIHVEPPKACSCMPRLTAVPLYTAKCIYKHKPDCRRVRCPLARAHTCLHVHTLVSSQCTISRIPVQCPLATRAVYSRPHMHVRAHIHTKPKLSLSKIFLRHGTWRALGCVERPPDWGSQHTKEGREGVDLLREKIPTSPGKLLLHL